MKYAWIAKHKAAWPITLACEVLGVSASGYFDHQRRRAEASPSRPSGTRVSNEALLAHIRARGQGPSATHHAGPRHQGPGQARKFVVTTHSKHSLPIAENLLARDFSPAAPDQVWASDITSMS